MKLTKDTLRSLISEVAATKREGSMLLSENMDLPPEQPLEDSFREIVDTLEGKNANVKTLGLMSAQNPMAQESSPATNAMLDHQLKQDLAAQGLRYIEIGGQFKNPEDSVMIFNPTQQQMHDLSRKYKQYSYVWGESLPTFTMMQIDYNQDQGQKMEPGSKVAKQVQYGDDVQAAEDFYSFDPKSGKKFVIPLY